MKRAALIVSILAVVLALPVQASSEGPEVRVALSAVPAGAALELRGALVNTAGRAIEGEVELRLPAGLVLAQGTARQAVKLAPGATLSLTYVTGGALRGRVPAELVFRPAAHPEGYSRGRVFLSQDGKSFAAMTTAQAIEAASSSGERSTFALQRLPRPLDEPAPNPDGGTAIKGRLSWYEHGGSLAAGGYATVELVTAANERAAGAKTDREGNWTLAVPQSAVGKPATVRFTMGNERWMVKRDDKPYAWDSPAVTPVAGATVDAGDLVLPKGLPSSEAAWIHGTLVKALEAFQSRNVDMGWWKQIGVEWPASGDFYSWGEVNLTEPYQWDVIGHEFGHAVFFTGTSSQAGGGQHKIDECYTASLAFSEGWATFFAAVCHLDRGDTDAKFQFLVPRRAPIRIENVPADVCQGLKNEWRVSAALWDLYDSHDDGSDAIAIDFDRQWAWMRAGTRMGSLSDYWNVIKKSLAPHEIEGVRRALIQSGVELQ